MIMSPRNPRPPSDEPPRVGDTLAALRQAGALSLQPGGMLDSQAHETGTQEHLSAMTGVLDVQAGDQSQRLKIGETARYAADRPHCIRNAGRTVASGWLVVVHPA